MRPTLIINDIFIFTGTSYRVTCSTKIYLRIIPNIQALAEAFDRGIAAHQRLLQHHFVDRSVAADDRFLDNGIVDHNIAADGDVRPDDGISDVAVCSDADGVDDDSIIVGRQVAGSVTFAVEQLGVGFDEDLFFAAIKPVVDRNGGEFYPSFYHAHKSVGELIFAVGQGFVFDILVYDVDEHFHFFDLVQSDHCHIRFRNTRFFHHSFYNAVVIILYYTKFPGIGDFVYAETGIRHIQNLSNIEIDDSIAKKNEDLVGIFYGISGCPDGVAAAFALFLVNELFVQVRVVRFEIQFDLFAEVADDEHKVTDAHLNQLIDNKRNDRFAGHRDERLRLGVSMRS